MCIRDSLGTLVWALSSFQRSLLSGNAPYDQYLYGGKKDALTAQMKRGMELFFSERLECNHCHGGFNFQDATVHAGSSEVPMLFHNTGLYNEDGNGAYPLKDRGVIELTGVPEDMGRFRAPSLRNVAVTAPYMHDGSIATLSEVLDHYAAGGRAHGLDSSRVSPVQSSFVRRFVLTPQEKEDVLAFFDALTDTDFLTDPRFADPALQP